MHSWNNGVSLITRYEVSTVVGNGISWFQLVPSPPHLLLVWDSSSIVCKAGSLQDGCQRIHFICGRWEEIVSSPKLAVGRTQPMIQFVQAACFPGIKAEVA
jgi:hypothetical protein